MASVKIRALTGNTYNCDYFPEETVGCLKSRIHEKQGTPYWQIRLIKDGKDLSDDTLMKDCKFGNGEPVLHLLLKVK